MDYIEFFKNDRFATEAGITLIEVRPGYAKAQLSINEHHLNAGNVVQGGALFTLADLAIAAAANANGRLAFSIQSDIRFLESATMGETLIAEAQEILLHKTICHYKANITTLNGRLIAICDGICYRK